MGWTRYADGSAVATHDNSGFRSFVAPQRRRFRWTVTAYGDPIASGHAKTAYEAERAADKEVARRLQRKAMRMDLYRYFRDVAQ